MCAHPVNRFVSLGALFRGDIAGPASISSEIASQTNLLALNATIEAARQTGSAADDLLNASGCLAKQAEVMRTEVEKYISGVKAA